MVTIPPENSTAGAHSPPRYDWYAEIPAEKPLEQGDLLEAVPIVIPPISLTSASPRALGHELSLELSFERFKVVVMTQSCDLVELGEEDQVILCPRLDYRELASDDSRFRGRDGWTKLVQGRFVGAHLINQCEIGSHLFDYQVIDLQRVFSVPLVVVKQVAVNQGGRVRLLPPYREHLAQAFARQFMRVGLPFDLPRQYPYAR